MARVVKFRVWDENKKVMVYGVEHFYDTEGEYFDEQGRELDLFEDTSFGGYRSFGDFIEEKAPLMEFTGLRDSNDKEIYEDDIVTINVVDFVSTKSVRCVVEYKAPAFVLSGDWAGFLGTNQEEVIGNIHANHELLK